MKSIRNTVIRHDLVSFKGDFLGNLIDAVALIDLAETVLKNNHESGLTQSNMTGIIILLEQIKQKLDIEAHLLEN